MYRPVSLPRSASKVLEIVVNQQVLRFFEENHLLPKSQYGFRSKRSTFSAVAAMHETWLNNKVKKGQTQAVTFFDLSAAFDALSSDIFCSKIKLYGFDEKSISWFRSYLTNRQQVVMIEDVISDPVTINVGSPQGAILSPTIFIILISDIGLYSRHFDTKNIARSHRSSSTGCYCELHTKITSYYNESRSCLNSIF